MRDEVIGRVEERETTDRFLVRLLDGPAALIHHVERPSWRRLPQARCGLGGHPPTRFSEGSGAIESLRLADPGD